MGNCNEIITFITRQVEETNKMKRKDKYRQSDEERDPQCNQGIEYASLP